MSEYSMPSYFQSMPVIGKDLSSLRVRLTQRSP